MMSVAGIDCIILAMSGYLQYNKGVKLTTVVSVRGESDALLSMIRQFNAACNYLSAIAFSEHIFYWLPLQRRAYHEIRKQFGLTSAQAVVAIRKVAYCYKHKARRATLASFKSLGAMPLYRHRYKKDGTVAFYGLRMPFRSRPGVVLSSKSQGTLCYQGGKFLIHQVVDAPEVQSQEVTSYIGCDLGIVNILADSDGKTYSGGSVNGLRKRHARLRAKLQSKCTGSAKRLLRKRRKKEGRFAKHVNHTISKQVVAKALDTNRGIALEDLGGIRDRITVRKGQRRQHHSWSFFQLRSFITYKAQLAGVPLVIVDPRNTSRTCPSCGCIDKANRASQSRFLCISCGFSGHADTVAAGNIAHRAVVLGRALGDVPYAGVPAGSG